MKSGLNWLKSIFTRPKNSVGFLLEFLLMTSAIALSAGVGFGAAIRFSDAGPLGQKAIQSEQSFPPRQDWPTSHTSPNTDGQKP
jgi:hypothetical protein